MIFDLGVPPEGVKFFTPSSVLGSLSIAGQRLFLRVEDEAAFLEAGDLSIRCANWQSCTVRLLWMWPAKGGGFSEVSLFDTASQKFTLHLLQGRFHNLEWMRGTAAVLAEGIKIPLEEVDLGADA